MYNVLPFWEKTNRDAFTTAASIQILVEKRTEPAILEIIKDERLISFNSNKSGDCLAGILTQDTITITFDNSDELFAYDIYNDIYQYAEVTVMCGYENTALNQQSLIPFGKYFICNAELNRNKMTFTAKSILGFMNRKFDFPVGVEELVLTGTELVEMVKDQAHENLSISRSSYGFIIDNSLSERTLRLLPSDNYSYAEILQLIANAFQCVLYVDRNSKIHIDKLGDVSENYVLSEKISYENPKLKIAEKIGDIDLYTNHGMSHTTAASPDDTGGLLTVTNPIVRDSFQSFELANHIISFQSVSRKRITGNFRADPRIDLFDIIIVPNNGELSVCAITKANFTYSGSWRGTYEAVAIDTATIDMRICDIEMIKIKQLKSLKVGQLSPNTVSDDADEYIATKNNEIMLWEE